MEDSIVIKANIAINIPRLFVSNSVPHQVEDIIDGILATPVSSKNGTIFVSVMPTKYVIKSFGVPGIRYITVSSEYFFFELQIKLHSFILFVSNSIFSSLVPNIDVSSSIKNEPISVPIIHSANPLYVPQI